jgi:hypothetical protein
VATNSWGYVRHPGYEEPVSIGQDLADIVDMGITVSGISEPEPPLPRRADHRYRKSNVTNAKLSILLTGRRTM